MARYLHIKSSILGMCLAGCMHDSLEQISFELSSLILTLTLTLLLLLWWTVFLLLWPDLLLLLTPMAARHEARHEFFFVEIIWAVGGLAVAASEACVVVADDDDFLSLCNLNIFKLNEYFESRAGTFILNASRLCVFNILTSFLHLA